jgi:hypothetical protein
VGAGGGVNRIGKRAIAIAAVLGAALLAAGAQAIGCANGEVTDQSGGGGGVDGGDNDSTTGSGSDGGSGAEAGDDSPSPCGDLQNDPKNCGVCGNTCMTDYICVMGRCTFGCTPPKIQCGGDAGGAPGSDAAPPGDAGAPDGDAGSPVSPPFCTDPGNDNSNCGTCGNVCPADHQCVGGQCSLHCSPGSTACPSADKCISSGTCCTDTDCTLPGAKCSVVGTLCVCPTADTYATTCATATDIPMSLHRSASVSGHLSTAGAEHWFSVTFTGNADPSMTYHPHVKFTLNNNSEFAFDIQTSCNGGTQLTCGDPDGGTCTSKTEWEVGYNTATTPAPDPNSVGFQPMPALGKVYIRVARLNGVPSCSDFTLSISN